MKFFDTHVHFFPDKLADKALPKLREISQCETHSDGTRSGTVKNFAEWGCAGGMVLHIATNAHQQTSVNNFQGVPAREPLLLRQRLPLRGERAGGDGAHQGDGAVRH